MHYILPIVGIIGSYFMVKYREKLGDMIGEAEWMKYVGGVYYFLIILAIFIFFLSIAELTNTTDILLSPLRIIPGLGGPSKPEI
jgi:hypothetical protein